MTWLRFFDCLVHGEARWQDRPTKVRKSAVDRIAYLLLAGGTVKFK